MRLPRARAAATPERTHSRIKALELSDAGEDVVLAPTRPAEY